MGRATNPQQSSATKSLLEAGCRLLARPTRFSHRLYWPFGAAFFFFAAEALAGAAAEVAAAAFAALTAAQRFLVAAIIARLPAALSFRFAGAAGPAADAGFESRSTGGSTAGGLPFRFVGP